MSAAERDRRLTTLTAVAAFTTGFTTGAMAETLRVSSFLSPHHSFNHAIAARREELRAATNGELQVEIFPAGQLGPPPRRFDLVRSGDADLAVILHGATSARFLMT